jgi:hypothetical protein
MANLDITGGSLSFNERKDYYSCHILGTSVQLYLTDAEIIQYSILITNIEMFGEKYWESFKLKMLHYIQKLDSVFIKTVDENIKWWERNEKLEKVLQ